jgi:hypothetical protein
VTAQPAATESQTNEEEEVQNAVRPDEPDKTFDSHGLVTSAGIPNSHGPGASVEEQYTSAELGAGASAEEQQPTPTDVHMQDPCPESEQEDETMEQEDIRPDQEEANPDETMEQEDIRPDEPMHT